MNQTKVVRQTSNLTHLDWDTKRLREVCREWKIAELALFGSALRNDFGNHSDVDLLVTYLPSADLSLLDQVHLRSALAEVFGREVDLVSRSAVERSENRFRREAILQSAEAIDVG